jgi:hypothetical protein
MRGIEGFVSRGGRKRSSGIKALSSLLARSWSRKALRELRKRAANSAQEFDELISTTRMASMRRRGGSALIR